MQVECKRCKTKWDYLGKYISNENASVTCPACLYKVKLYEKDVEDVKDVYTLWQDKKFNHDVKHIEEIKEVIPC